MWVTLGVVVNCWYKISQWFGILLKVGYLEKTFDLGYAAIRIVCIRHYFCGWGSQKCPRGPQQREGARTGAGGGRRGGGGTTKCTPIYEYSIAIPSLIRWPVSQYLGMTEGWYCQYMGTTHIKNNCSGLLPLFDYAYPPHPVSKDGLQPLALGLSSETVLPTQETEKSTLIPSWFDGITPCTWGRQRKVLPVQRGNGVLLIPFLQMRWMQSLVPVDDREKGPVSTWEKNKQKYCTPIPFLIKWLGPSTRE